MGCTSSANVSRDRAKVQATPALLVTGRRGPFPTYRLNGIYALVSCADTPTNIGGAAKQKGTRCSGQLRFQRVDRPEVYIEIAPAVSCSSNSSSSSSSSKSSVAQTYIWRCDLDNGELARGRFRSDADGIISQLECEVREADGSFDSDDNVIMVCFMAPGIGNEAGTANSMCSGKWDKAWQLRHLMELPPPGALRCIFDSEASRNTSCECHAQSPYTIWGQPGEADCLHDLLQGEIGNCGILSGVDALAHIHPEGKLGHRLRVLHEGGATEPHGRAETTVLASFFDPSSGAPLAWTFSLESAKGDGRSVNTAADVYVAAGTAVPRYARTLSTRVWGVLLERALADIAGGYDRLGECEPNMAWRAILGPGADCRRYWYQPADSTWVCNLLDLSTTRPTGAKSSQRLGSRSISARTQSWRRAQRWQRTNRGVTFTEEELEKFVETGVANGVPLCVHPVSAAGPSKETGEPCVPLQVDFAATPADTLGCQAARPCKAHSFALGHCYSIRDAVRSTATQDLWVRLRDPRRTRLFWAQWRNIVHAGEVSCFVYSCEGLSSQIAG